MQGILVIQGIVVIQGSSLGLLPCRQTLYHLSPLGSPGFVISHLHLLLPRLTLSKQKVPHRFAPVYFPPAARGL